MHFGVYSCPEKELSHFIFCPFAFQFDLYKYFTFQIYASSKFLVASSSSNQRLIFLDSPGNTNNLNSESVLRNASAIFASNITKFVKKLSIKYNQPSSLFKSEIAKLWTFLQPSVGTSTQLWSVAKEVGVNGVTVKCCYSLKHCLYAYLLSSHQWVGARYVVPAQSPLLGSILKTMSTAKIIKAQNAPGGTQLKLLITFEGGQQALFKPEW